MGQLVINPLFLSDSEWARVTAGTLNMHALPTDIQSLADPLELAMNSLFSKTSPRAQLTFCTLTLRFCQLIRNCELTRQPVRQAYMPETPFPKDSMPKAECRLPHPIDQEILARLLQTCQLPEGTTWPRKSCVHNQPGEARANIGRREDEGELGTAGYGKYCHRVPFPMTWFAPYPGKNSHARNNSGCARANQQNPTVSAPVPTTSQANIKRLRVGSSASLTRR